MNESNTSRSSRTDWTRVDAQSDRDIDTSDVGPLDGEWFKKAQIRRPDGTFELRVEVEPETLAWFNKQGSKARRMASDALANYAQSHKSREA